MIKDRTFMQKMGLNIPQQWKIFIGDMMKRFGLKNFKHGGLK